MARASQRDPQMAARCQPMLKFLVLVRLGEERPPRTHLQALLQPFQRVQ